VKGKERKFDLMENTNHKRHLWRVSLLGSFSKAFEKSTAEFTWQEKADFLELLIQYVQILQKNEDEAADFYSEKMMKPLKSKLIAAEKARLFTHFSKDFAYAELDIISTELFNSLDPSEQGMTDQEYEWFLNDATRVLKTQQYMHFVYAHDKEESNEQESLEGAPNVKGRIQRSSGDNLTKLNQEQTALLIDYLKEGRLILKDEYLNSKKAGMAFSILTGYSPDALRIKLGKKEISKIKTKENLKELDNVLTALKILIDKDIKGQK
jgi:hypothetical protein